MLPSQSVQRAHSTVTATSRTLMVALLLLLTCTAFAQRPTSSNARPYLPFPKTWQAALDLATVPNPNGVDFQVVPGTSMIVKSPAWGIRVGVSGAENIQTKAAPSPDKSYRIGSMTKMFTSMVVLQMEQEGLLKLTDTVEQYLQPQGITLTNADKITVRNCLQMTSGIVEYVDAPLFNHYPWDSEKPCPCGPKYFTPKDIMDIVNSVNNPPDYNPGEMYSNPFEVTLGFYTGQVPTKAQVTHDPSPFQPTYPNWAYTSSGYTVLGIIVEEISGKPLQDVIKERITDKLNLNQTYLSISSDIPSNMMQGYSRVQASGMPFDPPVKNWINRTVFNPSYAWSAGSVISSQWDMLRFLESVFTDEVLINNATRQKYMSYVSAGPMMLGNLSYGTGALMMDTEPFGTLHGHGGILSGFRSIGYYIPDSDTYFLIMVNTSDSYPPGPGNPDGIWPEIWIMDNVMPLVFAGPTTPTPNDGGTAYLGSSSTLTLGVQPGNVYGDSYNFYLGKDPKNLKLAGNVTAQKGKNPRYTTGYLDHGTDYYWKVEAVTGDGVYESPTWTFTTL